MKRTIEDVLENLDFVGCDNDTARELCAEIKRLHDTYKTDLAETLAENVIVKAEIERLRSALEDCQNLDEAPDLRAEIERLREELNNCTTVRQSLYEGLASVNKVVADRNDEIKRLRELLREGMEDQISEVASRYEGWPDNEYTKRRILRDSEWAMRVREALGGEGGGHE